MEKDIFKRQSVSHKGNYGRVGIIGGSFGMCGSIELASKATMRTGSGYVYTIIPESLSDIFSLKLTEAIIKPIKDSNLGHFTKGSVKETLEIIKKLDVLALGMGLGQGSDQRNFVKAILEKVKLPIVLDADGINCISDNIDLLSLNNNLVITPHPGEMATLLKVSVSEILEDREYYANYVANKYQITVVLKGHQTVVASYNQNTYINTTGNPGMATAGSGDVLSGIIASLIGQGLSSFEASKLGVYLHGLAGDLGAKKYGEVSLIASDIVEHIYLAIKSLTNE